MFKTDKPSPPTPLRKLVPAQAGMGEGREKYQIYIQNRSQMRIPLHAVLIRAAQMVLENFVSQIQLSIRITTEAESAQLNAHYRHKQGPTNVLAFPLMFQTDTLSPHPLKYRRTNLVESKVGREKTMTGLYRQIKRREPEATEPLPEQASHGFLPHPFQLIYDSIPQPPPPLLGDLVLCASVIKQEAQQQKKNLAMHFSHMVIHGTLHLLGFDHQTEEEAEKMESLEIEYLKKLGFSNPYESIGN
jgi:rRNA maturation RNase YbeY